MNWLLVVVGAAVGAPLRYLTDRTVHSRVGFGFPWGTLTVNVSGCALLGLLTAVAPPDVRLLLGTGLCGALSTYSTFSFETLKLAQNGSRGAALGNVALSLGAGLAAVYAGAGVGHAIWG
ncbi:fluoride efflux transporter CrcB [Kitasatospora saccharophila]|uniref:Fluoride-specific ion channel FluC n=1 Tax=Kitasatospora saccharophila TaxID=407973 RepID=A0ABP5JTG0_9ACTN